MRIFASVKSRVFPSEVCAELVPMVNEAVCVMYGVTEESLRSRDTSKEVSEARWFAWTLLHDGFGVPNGMLAAEYGRTRRAVCHAVSVVRSRVARRKDYAGAYRELSRRVCECSGG